MEFLFVGPVWGSALELRYAKVPYYSRDKSAGASDRPLQGSGARAHAPASYHPVTPVLREAVWRLLSGTLSGSLRGKAIFIKLRVLRGDNGV